MLAACGPASTLAPSPVPSETPLAPMFVADLGAEIIVADLGTALARMGFVEELGGRIADVVMGEADGAPTMTVHLRVPHAYAARVSEALRTEFGKVESSNVLAGEVSVRNARLRRELAAAEASLPGLSGADLIAAKDRIELLHGILAFQNDRTSYLYVEVRLVESD